MLETIAQQITIYVGFTILITGVAGALLNLIVFLSLKTFRENSCAFYLIIMSMFDIGQLLLALLSRIMTVGFHTEWTTSSIFFCKFRAYHVQICALTSLTCYCLSTIDQFCATTTHIRLQQWCNIKTARYICLGVVLLWILHGIPVLVYHNVIGIPNTSRLVCKSTHPIYNQYFFYGYQYTFCSFLPLFISILFGCLAYFNVRRNAQLPVPIARRELDKQLTTMVLCTVLLNSFSLMPYMILQIIPSSSTENEYNFMDFASSLTLLLFFTYYTVSKNFLIEK